MSTQFLIDRWFEPYGIDENHDTCRALAEIYCIVLQQGIFDGEYSENEKAILEKIQKVLSPALIQEMDDRILS